MVCKFLTLIFEDFLLLFFWRGTLTHFCLSCFDFCLLKLLNWADQLLNLAGKQNLNWISENSYREINFRFRIHRTVYGSSGAGRQLERIREFGFECQSHEFLRQELFLDPWDSWWQCPLSTKHGADESFGRFQHSFPATGKYTNTVEILYSAV